MMYVSLLGPPEAIDRLAKEMPKADVAVLASGGNVIPEVR